MRWKENNFLKLSPDNKALQFLAKRINSENYRGSVSSQHNRYTWEDAHAILSILNECAPNKSLLSMRTTDTSKRMEVNSDERKYTEFCEKCKEKTGIGTPDAMRKNLFPDFHRMGLINRYDRKKNKIDPYVAGTVKKYVALTERGLKFIHASPLDRHYIFSRCVNELLDGRAEVLLDIFNTPGYQINDVDIHEYTFFVSAIGECNEFGLTITEGVELLKAYRNLTKALRRSVVTVLKRDLDPDSNHPKPEKRDFHNWHNKTQQIYHLLKQTPYFDVIGERLIPIDIDSENRLERSISAKSQYFKEHGVRKQHGFELHHVVPLSYSECKNHFKLLDRWENMVYIDGFTHAKITQKKLKNVIMRAVNNDLNLLDDLENKITLRYEQNIMYAVKNQQKMIQCNQDLLNI